MALVKSIQDSLSDPHRGGKTVKIVEFEDGRLGIFQWTSVGYDSPLRWWR